MDYFETLKLSSRSESAKIRSMKQKITVLTFAKIAMMLGSMERLVETELISDSDTKAIWAEKAASCETKLKAVNDTSVYCANTK